MLELTEAAGFKNCSDSTSAAIVGRNYAKLQALKLRYEPENLFGHPQSVRLPE